MSVSWFVFFDVTRGRNELNLSTYGASGGESSFNPFDQSNDLAYQLGQFLAGGQRSRFPGGRPPNGQFLPPITGQTQNRFPEGGRVFNTGDRLAENIRNNQMPPANYMILHSTAKLTEAEREELLQGLTKTLSMSTK